MNKRVKLAITMSLAVTISLAAITSAHNEVQAAPASAFQAADPAQQAREHYARAQQHLLRSERDKAIEELGAAIRLVPEFVEAHHEYLNNQKSKAGVLVAQYEGYAKQNPGSALYHYLLGKAYINAGRRKEADAEMQKSLELDGEFSWTLVELAMQASNKNDQVKAAELLEKARKRAGDSAELHFLLASNLARTKHYESALREARSALELDPNYFKAYPIKWRARMSVTSGSKKTQDEIVRDAKLLEARHSNNVEALNAALGGYNIIFDADSAKRVNKSIAAIDPKYFERQSGIRMFTTTASGEPLEFSGPLAEKYFQAQRIKDPKEQLAALQKLEKEIEDPNIKLYFIYRSEISAYLKVDDLENAERLVDVIEKGGAGIGLAWVRVDLARAYVDRKIKLDVAQDYLQKAIESGRKSLASYEQKGNQPQAVMSIKNSLARTLHIQGRLFLAKGQDDKAVETFAESVKLAEQENNTLDLGLAYIKRNRQDDAIKLLVAAYSFEGPRKQEAKAALEQIYGDREKAKPLAPLLAEAVEQRKVRMREEAALSSGARGLMEGKPAPAFELASLKGRKVRLSDYQGKVVLLNFWATW